jgi:hypothetical protein
MGSGVMFTIDADGTAVGAADGLIDDNDGVAVLHAVATTAMAATHPMARGILTFGILRLPSMVPCLLQHQVETRRRIDDPRRLSPLHPLA